MPDPKNNFADLCSSLNRPNIRVLAFDPGETTGWAYMEGTALQECGQLDTKDLYDGSFKACELVDDRVFTVESPLYVVIEDYRIYGWKTEDHTWAELHTAKFIGCLWAVCQSYEIRPTMRMAVEAKGFCTDDKLKRWGFWQGGQRHARDAIRHACFHLLFNNPNKKK